MNKLLYGKRNTHATAHACSHTHAYTQARTHAHAHTQTNWSNKLVQTKHNQTNVGRIALKRPASDWLCQ